MRRSTDDARALVSEIFESPRDLTLSYRGVKRMPNEVRRARMDCGASVRSWSDAASRIISVGWSNAKCRDANDTVLVANALFLCFYSAA